MKTIGWGIIGCGNVTEVKSGPGFQKADGSRLAAVMRRSAAHAQDYARRHGVPNWYTDAQALIADPEVDAVYIATPPHMHHPYTLAAARAGKPVYVEKPMARTSAECEEMIAACQAAGAPLFVAYYRRALPRFLKVKELIESGAVGRLRCAKIDLALPLQSPPPGELPWRLNPEIAGGGLFIDLASHTLDFLDFVIGPIRSASGYAANQAGAYPAEDLVSAVFEFENGVQAAGQWCFSAAETADRIILIGERGKISLTTFDESPIVLETDLGAQSFFIPHPPHVQQPLIQQVVDELRGVGKCSSTGETALRTTRIMEQLLAGYYSAAEKSCGRPASHSVQAAPEPMKPRPTGRDRLLAALDHREPDRIPLDLGSTQVTGIHAIAYLRLREVLGLPPVEPEICDRIQGLALPDPDVIERLGVDVRGLFPLNSHNWQVTEIEITDKITGDPYWSYHDEWGITHRKPRPDGLYYSLSEAPLERSDLTPEDIARHPWPRLDDPHRIEGLRALAESRRSAGYAVVLKDPFAGIFEMSQRIVGMENLLIMMAEKNPAAEALFDRMVDLKLGFWEMALPRLADVVDVITQADDYGTQASQIISPRMFRQLLKPRWKQIFDRLRILAPNARRFFHSCGNVRPLLPDLIEIGVEILNPIHVRAAGMEPLALKRDFGEALIFWGGGVDTQGVLPYGSPEEVRDDVRRNIEALAPGGGYVFNTVHNIQADVPAENLRAMYEALLGVSL